jgi:hypothetical protein
VWSVLHDLERSALPEKDKHLLRFVEKMTTNLPAIGAADVAVLHEAGWDDEAIHFAITTCALFNFYNRWITASGVPEMPPRRIGARGDTSRRTATSASDCAPPRGGRFMAHIALPEGLPGIRGPWPFARKLRDR